LDVSSPSRFFGFHEALLLGVGVSCGRLCAAEETSLSRIPRTLPLFPELLACCWLWKTKSLRATDGDDDDTDTGDDNSSSDSSPPQTTPEGDIDSSSTTTVEEASNCGFISLGWLSGLLPLMLTALQFEAAR
jgi:hypothetical protein